MLAQAKPLYRWGMLRDPTEIMLTGGEPQLVDLHPYIDAVRMMYPLTTLYLYTTLYLESTPETLYNIDGVQFTIHQKFFPEDVKNFNRFQKAVEEVKTVHTEFSARLVVVQGAPVLNFDISDTWDSVRFIPWIEDCPLPVDEALWMMPT